MCSRVFVLRAFYLFSVDENLRGRFQQNSHYFHRCIFNMLMHQNECIREFENIPWSVMLFYYYLDLLAFNVFFVVVICSPHFICLWV